MSGGIARPDPTRFRVQGSQQQQTVAGGFAAIDNDRASGAVIFPDDIARQRAEAQ